MVGVLLTITVILCNMVECYAEDSYETYNEIMMVDGKLMKYFTEEELKEYYQKVKKRQFWGIKCLHSKSKCRSNLHFLYPL